METKAKINKWDLINLKSFCTTKETISKVKRQPSEWEKIIVNEATDKQLISKIYKQLLEENIGRTLSDINHSKILCDPPPRVMEIKAKINKCDLIKLKSFCTMKEDVSKVKRQPSEWEKIMANETTDKGLISEIY